MNQAYEIKLLKDKTRFSEIHELRILAWESSPKAHFVDDKLFIRHLNNDNLTDYIFYVEEAGEMIATVRIRILNDMSNLNIKYSTFSLPAQRPFGDYERLVVHPDFRGKGIVQYIDQYILEFAERQKIPFLITEAIAPRDLKIIKLGWEKLGKIDIGGFDNPNNVFQVISFIYDQSSRL